VSDAPGPERPAHGTTTHASCVAVGGDGALLRGPSGAGKSDLALRFAHARPDHRLVADDQVLIEAREGRIFAGPHPALAGLIEVRGVGIMRIDYRGEAELRLIVDLVPVDAVPRIPPDPPVTVDLGGVRLPMLRLWPHEASAPLKLRLAIEWAIGLAHAEADRQR
jgi:HPr kinase/phosphorylase